MIGEVKANSQEELSHPWKSNLRKGVEVQQLKSLVVAIRTCVVLNMNKADTSWATNILKVLCSRLKINLTMMNWEHELDTAALQQGTCCDILSFWKPLGELRLLRLTIFLWAYRIVKIHTKDWSLTTPWLPLRTQSSERISEKSSIRPFSDFAETRATECRSPEASSLTP